MITNDKIYDQKNKETYDFNPEHPKNVIVKDYSHQSYQEEDEKDFKIRTIKDENLFNKASGLDDEEVQEADMFNFGDEDDLAESDRAEENQNVEKDVE